MNDQPMKTTIRPCATGGVDVVGRRDERERHQPDDQALHRDEQERPAQAGHGVSSSCIRAPESSALGTKPQAPDVVTSGPKSEPSRLEVMITTGCSVVARDLRADVEAVRVGQLDVEQHDLRPQPAALRDRRGAVGGLTDDLEALGLEHACARSPGTRGGRRR